MSSVTCRQCGVDISTMPRIRRPHIYCSRRCSNKYSRINNSKQCSKCAAPVLARGLCPTHYSYWHRDQRRASGLDPRPNRPRKNRTCAACGKPTPGSNGNAADGLVLCMHHRQETYRHNRYRNKARRKIERAAHGTTGKTPMASGQCVVCSQWFIGYTINTCCSDVCTAINKKEQRRMLRDRRRARRRDAFRANVNRRKVFEADGYRCHICKRKTDQTKQVPHPRAPTIDHVIPLARGGTHEPLNVRTACFRCNASKSDTGSGDQLLLIII